MRSAMGCHSISAFRSHHMYRVLAIFILGLCSWQASADSCRVPEGRPLQWVADICLLKNETDDVTLESVQACIAEAEPLQTGCDSNSKYKAKYCRLLIENRAFSGTLEECVDNPSVHGQTVGTDLQ